MKVRIVNTGGPQYDTAVLDATSGQALDLPIRHILLNIGVKKEPVQATLVLACLSVDITADATFLAPCPKCGHQHEVVVEQKSVSEVE